MNQLLENFKVNDLFIVSQTNVKNLIDIISSVRNLRSELNIPYKEKIEINFTNNNSNFIKFLNDYSEELKRLLKLKKISFDINPAKNSEAAYILISETTLIDFILSHIYFIHPINLSMGV